jgi:hypothetical protein
MKDTRLDLRSGDVDHDAAAGRHIPAEANDRVRQDLALKLWAYYSERGQYAVLEPGAREKAMLFQGTQRNSPLNLALRMMMQFKQFPTTMITKTWETESPRRRQRGWTRSPASSS